jgi:hypothetical protein
LLNAYSGYQQIPLTKAYQPATMFITLFGYFCYVKMPFELKNAGATYQRGIQFYFKGQIGHNLEVYVDNIVVKSQRSSNLISDLEETFNNLKWFNIKLNPKNAPSESAGVDSWGTSSPIAASKRTLTRFQPSSIWAR